MSNYVYIYPTAPHCHATNYVTNDNFFVYYYHQ